MPLRDRLGAFAEPDFRILFLGRAVSVFGTAMAPIALAFAVLDLTGSATDLGLVLACASTPTILFLLVGGIWADRLPRHHVMVGADLVSGAMQAVLAVLLLTGAAEIWHVCALQVVRGTATAFFFPAIQGVVPQVVSPGRLQQANALLRMSLHGTQIAGAAVGALLVAVIGPGWAIAVDAATYLVGTAFLASLRLPRHLTLPARHFLRELAEGWREFRSRTWLWAIVVQFAFVNATAGGAIFVLGPLVADRDLGGPAAWGAIVTCTSIGMIVGGLVVMRLRPPRPLLVASLAVGLVVPEYFLLAAAAPVVAICAAAVLAGIGIDIFGVLWDTTLQREVPPEKLSRVASYDMLGSVAFMPIGYAVAGPFAGVVGVGEALVVAGCIQLAAVCAVLLVADVRNLRRVDESEPAPAVVRPAT